jgi:hypothetical protein
MIDASRTGEPGTEHYPARRADTQYTKLRHVNSEPMSRKSFLVNPLRQSPEKIITEPVTDTRQADQQHPFLERGAEYVTHTHARFEDGSIRELQRQSSEGKRGAQPKELDLVQSPNLKKPSFLAAGFPRRRMNQPAFESDQVQSWNEKETNRNQQIHHHRTVTATGNGPATLPAATSGRGAGNNQASSTTKTLVHVVASDEQARREFSPAGPAKRTSIESRTDTKENVWPILPASPKFDAADELAAREQEAEGQRRLDLEQRGTLWNA